MVWNQDIKVSSNNGQVWGFCISEEQATSLEILEQQQAFRWLETYLQMGSGMCGLYWRDGGNYRPDLDCRGMISMTCF